MPFIVLTFALWPLNIYRVLDGSLCIMLRNFFLGFPYILRMRVDASVYIPNLSYLVDKTFIVEFENCLDFLLPFICCSC